MNNHLQPLFDTLTQYLVTANSPLPGLFQSPINKATVNNHVAGLKINLPEEVYLLYNWHNGTKETQDYTLGQLWIFPSGLFAPIEKSIEAYHEFVGNDYWQKSMFMLFESGGGDMYLIDCDVNSPTYRQILHHNYGAVDYEVIIAMFDSIESLFLSIVECFEKKAYWHDESGHLKFDPKLSILIMKKNNPNSKFWDLYDWVQ